MSSSSPPPEYLMPCLVTIEQAVMLVFLEHPMLKDKDVEEVYDQFKSFYQKLAQGKEEYEPDSGIAARRALIEAILTVLDFRVDEGLDEHLVENEDVRPGGRLIPNVEAVYVLCFNILRGSVRFWRKEMGPRGYLNFITDQFHGGSG